MFQRELMIFFSNKGLKRIKANKQLLRRFRILDNHSHLMGLQKIQMFCFMFPRIFIIYAAHNNDVV